MGKFKFFLFLLVLGGCAAYVYLFSIVHPDNSRFAIVIDNERSEVIRVVGPGYTFEKQGLFPKRISWLYFPRKSSERVEIRVPIHNLEEIGNDRYAIVLPLNIHYEIILSDLSVNVFRGTDVRKAFSSHIARVLTGVLTKELYRYCVPTYNRDLLARESEAVVSRAIEIARDECRKSGIALTEASLLGIVRLPELAVYADGLKYLQELRDVERANARELLQLQGKIEREKIDTEQYVKRLERIAGLVKANPDLLRYIYIDRIADKVKVLVVAERTGMPFGLDFDQGPSTPRPPAKKGEIDNLR